ncbi:unnamed protein product [Brassica oleracea]
MMTMARHMMADTSQFRNKGAETTSLKNQLKDLQKFLESLIHNQQQANTYFDPLGSTSSGMPMYQGSYSPGFLFGHQTQKTRSPLPGFLSSGEFFTSHYGSTSNSYHPKTTCSKPGVKWNQNFKSTQIRNQLLHRPPVTSLLKTTKRKDKTLG